MDTYPVTEEDLCLFYIVVLLIVPSRNLHKYMNAATRLGMGDHSDFVFLHYHLLDGMKTPDELWLGPSDGQWANLLLISLFIPNYERYKQFIDEVVR